MNTFKRTLELLSFALPIIGTQVLNILVSFVSVIFIAHLGKDDLAASGLAIPTFITFFVCGNGALNAIGILISHQNEQGKYDTAKNTAWSGQLLALSLGVSLCGIIWHIQTILIWFGQDQNLIELTIPFFHIARFAIIPMLLSTSVGQFFIGIGQPRVALITSIITAPITLALSYALILGKWGCPQIGLSGQILAQLVGSTLILTMLVLHGLSKKYNHFNLFKLPKLKDLACIKQIMLLGIPISVQSGAELIAITITTYFMGWFGADALSASQIINQYVVLSVMVYIGLSQAVSILTSRAYATNDIIKIKAYAKHAVGIMTIVFIAITIIFTLYPVELIDLFLDKHNPGVNKIIHLGRIFFIIAIVTNYLDSIRFIFSGAYRGLHDSKTPMIVNIAGLWLITITSSYVLGTLTPLGPAGIRIGLGVGIGAATIYLIIDFYYRKLPWFVEHRLKSI